MGPVVADVELNVPDTGEIAVEDLPPVLSAPTVTVELGKANE